MPVTLVTNRGLSAADTGGRTSTVGEPSVARSGGTVFVTGNWYASRSSDTGATWTPVDPFSLLPPVDGGFCCDQTAIHVPQHDLFVWILQYLEKSGTNTLRIAVARAADVASSTWKYWDLQPHKTDPAWAGEWFDYNHAALSNNFLYVGTNVYNGDVWTRAVVFRLPLATLAAGGALTYDMFTTTQNGSLRCTQGARDVMYFASHNSRRQIRVFSWPESSTAVTTADVDVSPWRAGSYSAPCPDGNDWLSRLDDRITAGWVEDQHIGFAWSANSFGTQRPQPYVRVVRLTAATMAVASEPDLWHSTIAYALPDVGTNAAGDVGLTMFRGGGTKYPGHVVGIWNRTTNAWNLKATRDGSHSPSGGKWGDYVTCRRDAPDAQNFVAVGYTLQGGRTRTHIEPRFVRFHG